MSLFAQSDDTIKVHLTTVTAVPGHILDPGDYIFHRVNSDQPDVYSITLMQDHPQFIGYFQVEPVQRNSRGDAEVDCAAADAGGVRLLQAWYAPGSTDGHRFVYTQRDVSKLDRMAAARALDRDTATGQP